MDVSFSPLLSPWLVLPVALLLAAMACLLWKEQRDFLPLSLRNGLLLLRLLPLLLLSLWFLRPVRRHSRPLPGASHIVVLADATTSMGLRRDCRDPQGRMTTRWEAVTAQIAAAPPEIPLLLWRVGTAREPALPWLATTPFTPVPGETDLGAALETLGKERERPGAMPIRAALLLSDGRDWGGQLLAQAKVLAEQGLPVSTLCLGDAKPTQDLKLEFDARTPDLLQVGEKGRAVLRLTSNLPRPQKLTVGFRELRGGLLGQTELFISPHDQATCTLPLPPSQAPGERIFQAEIPLVPGDELPENNVVYHVVEYQHPRKRVVLYLGSRLDWEWRFLRRALESLPDLELQAAIRLVSPEQAQGLPPAWRPQRPFFSLGEKEWQDFPAQPEEYTDVDVVALPAQTAREMTQPQQEALLAFVQNQGGGVLWLGDGTGLPPLLDPLMPGKEFQTLHSDGKRQVELSGERMVFEGLFLQPELLPRDAQYILCQQPRRMARAVLQNETGLPLMLVEGNCGAGRAAWCGLTETWRWAFRPPTENAPVVHQTFWRQILGWLAENRQPQLEMELPPEGLMAHEENTIALRVLGPDFRPAENAQASLAAISLESTREIIHLAPDPGEPGRFVGHYTPRNTHPVQLHFNVQCAPGTQPLILKKRVVVRSGGREVEELSAQPNLLRDVARITGGRFFQDRVNWKEIPLSKDTPMQRQETPLLPAHALVASALACLILEYFLRRRNGQA
ncbi:MAG: hypothetical protein ACI4SG_08310 [Oligosphaeraceae bacterium]